MAIATFLSYSNLQTRNINDSSNGRWYDDTVRHSSDIARPSRINTLRIMHGAHKKNEGNDVPSSENLERISDGGEGRSADFVLDTISSVFTAVDEQHLHDGRVVRELSHRVLSRNIAQSNVVIVSPNFGNEAHVFTDKNIRDDSTMKDIAMQRYYPAKVALEQGHTTHLLPTSTKFAEGWQTSSSPNNKYNSTSVGWILLAYFATQKLDTSIQNPHSSIDDILSPSQASSWLQQTTITYMVFPISAKATIPLSSILGHEKYEYEMDYTVNKTIEMTGLTAAKTLLESNYKLQLLSSSHYFDEMNDGTDQAYYYGPNALFQSVNALHRFLYERAVRALRKEVNNIRQHYWQSRRPNDDTNPDQILEVQFHSLLFATQGLDLAIPARSSYTDVGNHKECRGSQKGGRKERCDPKLNARAMNDTIFLDCPHRHNTLNVQFVDEHDTSRRVDERTDMEKSYGIMIDLNDGKWMKPKDEMSGEIEVWSGSEDPSKAEAVCVKADKNAILPRVSCRTRITPTKIKAVSHDTNKQHPDRPNLLVIMIDPLSRQQMRRSLPNTWAMLEMLGFVEFRRYTAVGNNSGPNQAALYSGKPLEGRQGIRTSNNSARTWIWDRLNDAGYVTMKAEDGCISNSNMVQSIDPKTHHGKQLHEMFCFSYDRPNCLGGKLAAEHLVDYTRQFIDTYNRRDEKTSPQTKPWAAFISFIDSHEDSATLISYLDGILLNFLQDIPMQNTMILFTSDHGMHYGPGFASKSGETERAQPLLYLRMPSFKKLNQLRQNAQQFTTAFDVHETLIDVILGKPDNPSLVDNQLGMSLVKPLPQSRNQCSTTHAIPSKFCSLVDDTNQPEVQVSPQRQCTFMIEPPSVFSFYSDIPQNNRPQWPSHCPIRRNHVDNDSSGPCFCATNNRGWFDCSNMTSINFNSEYFSLRSCSHHELDQQTTLDIHVTENEHLVRERNALAKQTMKRLAGTHHEDDIKASFDAQPNIIFLEIDSVSLSFSERHFPLTWGLLQKHKIITEQEDISCPSGWCAGVFNKTSVVGQSSIVNQLAALSGCLQYDDTQEELKHYKDGPQTHCPSGGKNSFGVDEETGVDRDHWIFEVAKNLGYITFFGEEFCYEESPYVVQTQSAFTLDVDLTPSDLFCNLAKDWLKVNGKVNHQLKTYAVEYDGKEIPNTCFDGKSRGEIGLEIITQMWDEYDSSPKFAFLNALAAHDYSLNAAHASLGAENYDAVVYRFLSSIMARNDSRDTYVVLRSDHGLQGGPYPIDYATQIEHMHPWTAIIAPAYHPSLSTGPFSSNQNMLVTGFDIYHSIRYLMSPNKKQNSLLFDAGIPRWSYNLFQQKIPSGRNCQDAKIPKEFCPCMDERSDMAPSFYVGHSERPGKLLPLPELRYDWRTMRFAAPRLPGLLLPKNKQIKYDVSFNEENMLPPRCNATLGSYIDDAMLQDSWRLIGNITSLYPGSDVSGGIFLYPRQTILLTYLVQRELASRAAEKRNSNNLEPFRICETGFGSGHSAALFLSAAPNVEVVSFDSYSRPYQSASFHALKGYFGKRLTRVIGDSCDTVKSYAKQCDFLHGSSLCNTDNIDLIHKSGAGVTLSSTAMKSLEHRKVYFGKDAQWATLLQNNCIGNVFCFREEEMILDSKLHLARGREQRISHQFCFAVNTGTCGTESKMQATVVSTWLKDDFCPTWRIPLPIAFRKIRDSE
eukprot:CAMPEP_0172318456 /NCGR_PEP_ID=MMETSP1058-20130122/34927_1 /TAXON_ID=83371 /ORGANISM="Detonula confervacea, Strain CCMP 353" /LENGTH=1694 /DNA_ID=CAMNT_0013033295 /DNA_START=295 /DNA_END=5379 /DNA_ORIENTATION=+